MDPESLQQALGEGVFEPARTPEQEAALARLETMLALVEGWVDEVVDSASGGHLPSAAALRETIRRRRATGGPAEQTFAALVGLELRPRRLREAATLWRLLGQARGVSGRDDVWSHPDLLPGPAGPGRPGAVRRSGDGGRPGGGDRGLAGRERAWGDLGLGDGRGRPGMSARAAGRRARAERARRAKTRLRGQTFCVHRT